MTWFGALLSAISVAMANLVKEPMMILVLMLNATLIISGVWFLNEHNAHRHKERLVVMERCFKH